MTLNARYYIPDLRGYVNKYWCKDNQKHKLPGNGYSKLPEQDLRYNLVPEVTIDLIGPWEIKVKGRTYTFSALACIDTISAILVI